MREGDGEDSDEFDLFKRRQLDDDVDMTSSAASVVDKKSGHMSSKSILFKISFSLLLMSIFFRSCLSLFLLLGEDESLLSETAATT